MRLGLIFLIAALAAGPVSAQPVELDGGNATDVAAGIEAEGSADIGTDDGGAQPDDADTPSPGGDSADPSQTDIVTSPATDEDDCSDPVAFEAQRDAFLEQEPVEDIVYIRRIDVSVCGYDVSVALIARLNSLPAIQAGLEHMQIDAETIVSARWTDDRGLLVYTAGGE